MIETLFICLVFSQISLVTYLISNSPTLFGLDDVAVWYETSFINQPGANITCAPILPSNICEQKEIEHTIITCPSGRTYTPGHDAPAIAPEAPVRYEGSIGVYTWSASIS